MSISSRDNETVHGAIFRLRRRGFSRAQAEALAHLAVRIHEAEGLMRRQGLKPGGHDPVSREVGRALSHGSNAFALPGQLMGLMREGDRRALQRAAGLIGPRGRVHRNLQEKEAATRRHKRRRSRQDEARRERRHRRTLARAGVTLERVMNNQALAEGGLPDDVIATAHANDSAANAPALSTPSPYDRDHDPTPRPGGPRPTGPAFRRPRM